MSSSQTQAEMSGVPEPPLLFSQRGAPSRAGAARATSPHLCARGLLLLGSWSFVEPERLCLPNQLHLLSNNSFLFVKDAYRSNQDS